MQHEGAHVLALQGIDALLVIRRTQRDHRQALRLAPREYRGSMRPRQHAHFTGNRANVRRATAIGAHPLLQNHVPNFRIFQTVEDDFYMPVPIRASSLLELLDRLRQDLIQPLLPRALIGNEDGFADRPGH